MLEYVYDIECLTNLFTATFVNVEDDNDKHVFYIGLDRPDYSGLLKFLNQKMILVGYNNDNYDNPMLRYIMGYKGTDINHDLHCLSGELVSDSYKDDREIIALRYPRNIKYPWTSVDLMRILAFDKLGISLKQTSINLKWYMVQDMPIDHNEEVTLENLSIILAYNLNDVLITKRLYQEITPIRELREELTKIYGVDLTSASDSRMANLILETIYSKEMKMDMRAVKDMRTKRDKVYLRECVAKFVQFQSPELNEMLDRIRATIVYEYKGYKYSESIYYANCSFSLGVGGLHTEDEPGVFETDDNYIIQDMDVASYYPNLIINNNFYPRHLGPNFITVLKKITAERLAAKKSGNKVKADGLKITVNSIFGKLGSDNFWLLDAKQMLSTTISGQMGLLMMVEGLHMNGIHVISCNTDGVVCKIPRELESKYYEIAKSWEAATGLELEFTPYKKYVRRDVNSYITEKQDGKTKEKGAFLKEVDLKKSYHMPIVAKALYGYFIKGVPVRETLENCKDIMEFCISQKSGNNFGIEIHSNRGIEKLQKTNRFFISKKGGRLIKRDKYSNKLIGLHVGRLVSVLNNYDSNTPFATYDVDLSFYEKEVMKIVDEIEPPQLTLFEMSSIAKGTIKKAKTSAVQAEVNTEKINVTELNKLGKNQLIKRIESIAVNQQKVDEINPRYVYVMNFDTKTMMADVYCLAKGVRQTIPVSRAAYKRAGLEKGQLIFCTSFSKKDYVFTISEYRVADKVTEEKEKLM